MSRRSTPPPAPKISDAEWTVMNVLWERGTSTLGEVVRELEGRLHWKPRTVQSLIRRGFVRSRAAPSLRSIESQPSTQGFVSIL